MGVLFAKLCSFTRDIPLTLNSLIPKFEQFSKIPLHKRESAELPTHIGALGVDGIFVYSRHRRESQCLSINSRTAF